MEKYTAIYTDCWMAGSHQQTLAKMRRIERAEHETVIEMLKREGIDDSVIYLFNGHPTMQGE
jgi:hypothetical protein